MFNLGGAMKNITAKAEELVEEKKHAATSLLEKQTSKHDIGGGGLLGEVENSNGHVANNVEHNIEGSVHKLEGKASSVTRKLDDSVDGEVIKTRSINVIGSIIKIHKLMDKIHEAIDKIHEGVDMLHEVADQVHQVADKVLQKTCGKVKAVFSLIQNITNGMVNIPRIIAGGVKGMLKGSFAACKKTIKLTAKVVLFPYTLTKAVLKKTSKVLHKTGGKVKVVFSLIQSITNRMVNIPGIIAGGVKGMLKGSYAAWKKTIKLTAKVVLFPYTMTKAVLNKTSKVLQKTGGKVKAVFSLIQSITNRMVNIPGIIAGDVKGMLKGSFAAWKKAIKLTAKVVLLPYTITKKVLHKTSKVMGLIFGNEVPKLVDPVSNRVIQ